MNGIKGYVNIQLDSNDSVKVDCNGEAREILEMMLSALDQICENLRVKPVAVLTEYLEVYKREEELSRNE